MARLASRASFAAQFFIESQDSYCVALAFKHVLSKSESSVAIWRQTFTTRATDVENAIQENLTELVQKLAKAPLE